MARARFCRNCGIQVSPTDAFCPDCGAPINPSANAPTTTIPNRPTARTPVTPSRQRIAGSNIARIIVAIIGGAALIIAAILGTKIVIMLYPPASPTSTPTNPPVASPSLQTSQAKETHTFPLAAGLNGFRTDQSYVGTITLMVSGTGQAKQTALEDPLYIYTDFNGNSINAYHDPSFSLCINYKSVDNYWLARPDYNITHTYTFKVTIPAPGGNLVFGICDDGVRDNAGSFTIAIY